MRAEGIFAPRGRRAEDGAVFSRVIMLCIYDAQGVRLVGHELLYGVLRPDGVEDHAMDRVNHAELCFTISS